MKVDVHYVSRKAYECYILDMRQCVKFGLGFKDSDKLLIWIAI